MFPVTPFQDRDSFQPDIFISFTIELPSTPVAHDTMDSRGVIPNPLTSFPESNGWPRVSTISRCGQLPAAGRQK